MSDPSPRLYCNHGLLSVCEIPIRRDDLTSWRKCFHSIQLICTITMFFLKVSYFTIIITGMKICIRFSVRVYKVLFLSSLKTCSFLRHCHGEDNMLFCSEVYCTASYLPMPFNLSQSKVLLFVRHNSHIAWNDAH